jgi:hypothetical protein
VTGKADEIDINRLRVGQPVLIGGDAFPGDPIPGHRRRRLGPLRREGWAGHDPLDGRAHDGAIGLGLEVEGIVTRPPLPAQGTQSPPAIDAGSRVTRGQAIYSSLGPGLPANRHRSQEAIGSLAPGGVGGSRSPRRTQSPPAIDAGSRVTRGQAIYSVADTATLVVTGKRARARWRHRPGPGGRRGGIWRSAVRGRRGGGCRKKLLDRGIVSRNEYDGLVQQRDSQRNTATGSRLCESRCCTRPSYSLRETIPRSSSFFVSVT